MRVRACMASIFSSAASLARLSCVSGDGCRASVALQGSCLG